MSEDFIEVYEGTMSEESCNEFVYWFDYCSENGFTISNMKNIKRTKRSDETISIPSVHSESVHHPQVISEYWNVLSKCLRQYVEKYSLLDNNLSSYVFKIHKVKPGQGYHQWHWETEEFGFQNRIVVWMTYLTAPEEGGETEFLHQSKRIKPEVGKTILWPAGFTHLHRGNPPLKGDKLYITGWFEIGEKNG